jgi:transposase InsO family protein
MLYCDNGSEFTSQVMDLRAYHHKVEIAFSRPGKPTDNAFVESFNGTLRDECLNAHWFTSLADATRSGWSTTRVGLTGLSAKCLPPSTPVNWAYTPS